MRSVYNSCTFSVKALYALKDIVSALRVNSNGRFVKDYQLRFVSNSAGDIKTAQKTSRKLFGAEFNKISKCNEIYGFLYILLSFCLVGNIKSAEIIYIFINGKLLEN